MKFTYERSAKWCKQQAIATGKDFHESQDIIVDPAELTLEARGILVGLSSRGVYPNAIELIGYNRDFTRTQHYNGWGSCRFKLDRHHPTAAEISAAIIAASAEIDARQAAETAEKAAKVAKAQRIDELKAELAELEA